MKKKTTKLFSAALVLAMSASVLTGCGKRRFRQWGSISFSG